MTAKKKDGAVEAADRAFGEENRLRLIGKYFDEVAPEPVTTETLWRHVYRLLLWVDRTNGLAHCYESDKCQPGKPWYPRSLRFHAWLSEEFGTTPLALASEVDWLFRTAVHELAEATNRKKSLAPQAEQGVLALPAPEMPIPGEDSALEALLLEALQPWLAGTPPRAALQSLTGRIQSHLGTENKRKNLLGEGFEDTVAELLRRLPGVAGRYDIRTRTHLDQLPGFNAPRGKEKPKPVDLALIDRSGHRTLVTCKWSVRSDREEQLGSDFAAYERREATQQRFDYVLLTNEFDPARLASFCDAIQYNSPLLTHVVHVATAGPKVAYTTPVRGSRRSTKSGASRALAHMESGRLMDLSAWAAQLADRR